MIFMDKLVFPLLFDIDKSRNLTLGDETYNLFNNCIPQELDIKMSKYKNRGFGYINIYDDKITFSTDGKHKGDINMYDLIFFINFSGYIYRIYTESSSGEEGEIDL